ncbi:hypothetical protein [Bradyrhizobium manausense]|uniref:hypothetical protein n=1 Tax=Bradyrhizobium manausense TaxID=989370 RepID=UPI00138F0BDB|nr:hypothetical protein [Bradyrhizobium manausense]
MVLSDADRFKKRAEECGRLAEQSASEEDKEGWLRLAREWEKLAASAAKKDGIFRRHE